jgi:hypothetical protein
MCPLYDDIEEGANFNKQMHTYQKDLMTKVQQNQPHELPVGLPRCQGIHLYHKECLKA